MSATTSRIYNATDGPLIIDDEGHVLASREHTRVKDLEVEPIAGHLEAGRLVDTTEAKDDGQEAEEQLAAQVVEQPETKPTKGANTTPRS